MNTFRGLLLGVVLLFTGGTVSAEEFDVPEQKLIVSDGTNVITDGKSIPLGEMVDLSVTPVPDKVPHLSSVHYEWKLLENGKERKFKSNDAGTNIWGPAGVKAKKQQVFVVCTYLYVIRQVDGDPKSPILTVATRTCIIYGEVTIGDNPEPAPAPGPTLADGKYKLAKSAYDLVLSKVPADADRVKASKALADSFLAINKQITAGTLTDPKKILSETVKSNQKALSDAGINKDIWDPFFTDFTDVIYGLYSNNKIGTTADFAAAWTEISNGLNAIK
jgi:hypothetical protein